MDEPRSLRGSRASIAFNPFADSFFGSAVELCRRERGKVARLRVGELFGDDVPERIEGAPGQFFNLDCHGEEGIDG